MSKPVHTRFVPPRLKNFVSRSRLLDVGRTVPSQRITTVVAPAGYGKSAWVSSLLDEAGWPLTAWLSLDSHDAEPSYFLYHLIQAIRSALPAFGGESLRTVKSLKDAARDWPIAVDTIVEEMPSQEMVVVLDDFHLVENSAPVCWSVSRLIQWHPANVHLVIVGRNPLPLALHHELLRGELLEVHGEHLLFSIEETGELLASLGLQLEAGDVSAIHVSTAGWPAGLRLLGMFIKQTGGGTEEALASIRQINSACYEYLSSELVSFLPPELQAFLLDSTLLPYLEPALCNAAMDCANSEQNLRQLHSYGLLQRVESGAAVWRLHHLIGDHLSRRAEQALPGKHVEALRRRAAAFFERSGDIDRALEQAVAGCDWGMAAELIGRHGQDHFMANARLDSLYAWISRIPPQQVAKDHRLLYFRGMSVLHADPEEALVLLSRSAKLAAAGDDIRGQVRSLMAMLSIHNLRNDLEKLKETAGRIPVIASLVKDTWSRGVILVAALGRAVLEDQLQHGVWLSRLAGRARLDPEWRMYYLFYSAIINYRLGNMGMAGRFIEEALALPLVGENDQWKGTAYEILSGITCDTGDQARTVEISLELLRLGQKYNVPHQIAYAYRRLSRVYLRDGDLAEARHHYMLSRHRWLEAGNLQMARVTDLEVSLLRSLAGEDPKSLLEEMRSPLGELLAAPTGQGYRDYALCLAGMAATEAGDLDQAGKWLEESIALSAAKGARQLLAGTLLHLSRLYRLLNDDARADNCLRRALGLAEASKLEVLWDWHPEALYGSCRLALVRRIHPEWAARLLCRWFPQRTRREAASLLAHPDERVRARGAALLQETGRESGMPCLHATCLGGFRLFVNGVEVPGDRWKTQKAENLFKFLITVPGEHPKEKIIEVLWPESNPRSGDASLRMALTHLRQATGLKECGVECVSTRHGRICLNPALDVYIDYEVFDSRAEQALSAGGAGPVALELLEQAAGLYTGAYLPGNPYDDWAAGRRAQLHERYLGVLARLIECYGQRGNPGRALQACHRYLAAEPADEQVCRKAMELLWRMGKKQQALTLFRRLTAALAQEYDAMPSPETSALYDRIRLR